MVDVDRDGLPEIFVANAGAPNFLYKWDGNRLVDIAPPIIQDAMTSAIGVAAGDFTGNGWPDLYVLNTSAFLGDDTDPDRLLINEGRMAFRDVMADNPSRNLGAGRSVAWLDLYGDGQLGVYVCNYGVPSSLYVRLKNGDVVDLAPELGIDQVTGGRSVICGDFLGSGRMDIFTANENDANRYFRNDGEGKFSEIAEALGLTDGESHARGLVALDFNRDGRIDLAWGNWEGAHRLMRQDDKGRFRDVAGEDFARPSRVRTVIAFDYDNDGWEDIFFNNLGEANRLPGPLLLAEGLGTGATVGDINGDGFLDVFVSHGEPHEQRNALLLNSPNENKWLRVCPLTPSGAPAIGAKVTVVPENDDRPITRIIDGGSGYLCQMEQIAHAGLGKAKGAKLVEVRFTTGQVWRKENVPSGHSIYVNPSDSGFAVNVVKEE